MPFSQQNNRFTKRSSRITSKFMSYTFNQCTTSESLRFVIPCGPVSRPGTVVVIDMILRVTGA